MTIVGFVIAFVQLTKVKSAAAAARDAVVQMTDLVRSHEQSAKIQDALSHVRAADEQLRKRNGEAAIAYLHVGWTTLLEARELTLDADDRNAISTYVVVVRRTYEDLRSPMSGAHTYLDQHANLAHILDGLGNLAARIRIRLAGIGATRL